MDAKGARSASGCLCVFNCLENSGKGDNSFHPLHQRATSELASCRAKCRTSQAARVANISDVLYAAAAAMTECLAVSAAAAPAMYTVPTSNPQSRLGWP